MDLFTVLNRYAGYADQLIPRHRNPDNHSNKNVYQVFKIDYREHPSRTCYVKQ